MDEKLIEKEVIKETALSFSKKIEDLVWEKDITYFESLQTLMSKMSFEPEYVAKLLTPEIKSKLTIEMEELNLVKKEKNRLF